MSGSCFIHRPLTSLLRARSSFVAHWPTRATARTAYPMAWHLESFTCRSNKSNTTSSSIPPAIPAVTHSNNLFHENASQKVRHRNAVPRETSNHIHLLKNHRIQSRLIDPQPTRCATDPPPNLQQLPLLDPSTCQTPRCLHFLPHERGSDSIRVLCVGGELRKSYTTFPGPTNRVHHYASGVGRVIES